jgi:hypothetical protein
MVGWASSRGLWHGSSAKEPDVIAVRAGRSDRRMLGVPVGESEGISPREGRVLRTGRRDSRRPAEGAIGVGSCDPRNERSEVEIWPDRFAP